MARVFRIALTLGLLFTAAAGTANAAEEKKECKIAVKGDNAVVKACKAGGIARAKATMKAMQKVAKEKGMKTDCDSCHKNEEDWALTENGEKDFHKMLELVK